MQVKIFTIPILHSEDATEELNHFLRANKVVEVKKSVVQVDDSAYWTFCISYLPQMANADYQKGVKIDYKEVLGKEEFARFSEMRKLRKQIAEREAVPAYAVFTDAELAELAKIKDLGEKGMLDVVSIGKKKAEKYGHYFLTLIKDLDNAKSGTSDREDSGT